MVASDTVVGIVGAVVLVAVMAGVFVYEYNNPATDDGSSGGGASLHEFTEQYPTLDATGDIDGDGISNLEDDDMDGDGTVNGNDTDVAYAMPVSGTRPQQLPSVPMVGGGDAGQAFAFTAGNGSVHIAATVTYTATSPAGAPTPIPNLAMSLRTADGETAAQATRTQSGNTVTLTISFEDPPAGEYTLVVRQGGAGPAANFAGMLEVHYPAPMAIDHEHD